MYFEVQTLKNQLSCSCMDSDPRQKVYTSKMLLNLVTLGYLVASSCQQDHQGVSAISKST